MVKKLIITFLILSFSAFAWSTEFDSNDDNIFDDQFKFDADNITTGTISNSLLDSDLAAIAILSTSSYGRALLELADQAALQAYVGSDSIDNIQGYEVEVADSGDTGKYLKYTHGGDPPYTHDSPGGGGDMLGAVWDGNSNGYIDTDAGGTDSDNSASTGVPYWSAGTYTVESQLDLARGGTGGDTSAYSGLLGINAGAPTEVDTPAELETYAGLGSFFSDYAGTGNEAEFKAAVNLEPGTDVLAEQTIGIADDNLLEVDGSPNDGEYARFTANGLEGRTEAEFKADFNLEIGTDVLAEKTIGIADDNLVEIDSVDVADDEYARFTANGLESRTEAEFKADFNLEIGTDVLAQQTIGIADDNLVEIDSADVADDEYARFTANGLESRTEAEFKSDFNLEIGTDVLAPDGDGSSLSGVLPLAGGTLTGEVTVDNLGLEFTAGDDHADCSAFSSTGGGIFYDDSEGKFKKCEDNVLTDLNTDTGAGSYVPIDGSSPMTGELTVDELGIEFQETDGISDCSGFSATGGGIFYDDSEGVFKKCQDNVLTTLDTSGAGSVGTSGTPVADDIAQFTDASTIKGMTYAELAAIAGFESALEGVLDLEDLQGSAGDANVDDTITASNYLPLAGGTLTGEVTVDNLGLEFTEGDDHSDCSAFSATGGGIFYDDSEGIFKKCQDNVLTDLDTGGGGTVDTSGTPEDNDIARFTDADTIEGVTYSELAGTQAFEDALEEVLDLEDLDGAVTDAQVPDTITITNLSQVGDVTSTAAEVNILDGVTSTTAELNILDGVTATTAELNHSDGVTSNIQTQLDGKMDDLVDDTTPQLGGDLDINNQPIFDAANSITGATPSVNGGTVFKTNNSGATTMTGFSNMTAGQMIWVLINDSFTEVDFSGTNLKGHAGASTDWDPASGDIMACIALDATDAYCIVSRSSILEDTTIEIGGGVTNKAAFWNASGQLDSADDTSTTAVGYFSQIATGSGGDQGLTEIYQMDQALTSSSDLAVASISTTAGASIGTDLTADSLSGGTNFLSITADLDLQGGGCKRFIALSGLTEATRTVTLPDSGVCNGNADAGQEFYFRNNDATYDLIIDPDDVDHIYLDSGALAASCGAGTSITCAAGQTTHLVGFGDLTWFEVGSGSCTCN